MCLQEARHNDGGQLVVRAVEHLVAQKIAMKIATMVF
jgi:hypothetical protein